MNNYGSAVCKKKGFFKKQNYYIFPVVAPAYPWVGCFMTNLVVQTNGQTTDNQKSSPKEKPLQNQILKCDIYRIKKYMSMYKC